MTQDNGTRGFGSFLSAFLLGATAGATVALLTAPRSGRETRAQLKSAALDLQKNVQKKMQRAPEAIKAAGAKAAKAIKAGEELYEETLGDIERGSGLS